MNPFSSKKASNKGAIDINPSNGALFVVEGVSGDNVAPGPQKTSGTIVVSPHITSNVVDYVYIYAHDVNGTEIPDKTVIITP